MRVCLFCGSSEGTKPVYGEAADEFGRSMGRGGHTMVFGGGRVGLMGRAANAALEAGARVIGVIPHGLADRELAHKGVTELVRVDTMHQRKAYMANNADAFAILPGGAGTHDEFFEMWTWVQIGIHDKPIGFLNVDGFFDPLIGYIEHLVREGFLAEHFLTSLIVSETTEELLERLAHYGGTPTKWDTP